MRRRGWVVLAVVVGVSIISAGAASASTGVNAWGDNSLGQIGNGNNTGPHSNCGGFYNGGCATLPVAVSGLSGVTAIAAGGYHSLALLYNGTVMAWGVSKTGALGNGNNTGPDTCGGVPCATRPVAVSGLSGVTAIAAGEYGGNQPGYGAHSLALLNNGTVMAWGDNSYGELGNGNNTGPDNCGGVPCATRPVAVSGLGGVTAIAAGDGHSLALLNNGTVMAWGVNYYGQLGNGNNTGPDTCTFPNSNNSTGCATTPVAVSGLSGVTAIAAGGNHDLALLNNGTVMGWGDNFSGELGNGNNTGPDTCIGVACATTPVAVSGLSGVKAIAAGGDHDLALLNNGTVMGWGDSCNCGLGKSYVPVTVKHLSGVKAIAAGDHVNLALLNKGTVKAWGYNEDGELGIGHITYGHRYPVKVKDLKSVQAIAVGAYDSFAIWAAPPDIFSLAQPTANGGCQRRATTLKCRSRRGSD